MFRYTGKNCKDVYLIGSFTNWKEKISTAKSDGDYVAIIDLPEGEHQYKFVVDGKWEHDPTQVLIIFCVEFYSIKKQQLFFSHQLMIHLMVKIML